jgi:hypothetical protein
MIELREDGTLEGAPKVGRIYKLAYDGRITLILWEGELETDFHSYVERYETFRGYLTDFLPLEEARTEHARLLKIPTPSEELEAEKVRHLKKQFLEAHKKAEQAAHAYFAACPVGEERTIAAEIYENVRTAIRV